MPWQCAVARSGQCDGRACMLRFLSRLRGGFGYAELLCTVENLQPGSLAIALLAAALPATVRAQSVPELLSAVVRVKAFVPSDSRTAETLGREREGSGIVIDQDGLILTIGYLMVEAQGAEVTGADGRTVPAQIVGYDHDSGFGLLRADPAPVGLKPLALGRIEPI